MGCNCKRNQNGFRRLSDENDNNIELASEDEGMLTRLVQIVSQFIFGLIVGVILIVCIVPMLVYIIGCLALGKEPSFRIINFRKRFKHD